MKENISQTFRKYKVNNILFTNVKEIFYLTGEKFDNLWLLFVKDKIYVICSKTIENQIKDFFANQNITIICSNMPFYKIVIDILKQNNADKLLIDLKYINAVDFILINEKLNNEKINIAKKIGILDDIRIVKNTNEINNIKEACRIVSEVCNIVKDELRPGLSELDIHYRVSELFAKNHVPESFRSIIASGPNSANPHHISSIRKITKNDIVVIDIGCMYNGYCSDLTRTYFLGRIDNNRMEVWNIVRRAQSAILKDIKAGMPVSWADKTTREIIAKSGYGYIDKFIHNTGHGVGIEIHEMPSLSSNAEGIFLTNMTVTVEPGIYIKRDFGVRIEDTILIKETGCVVLTSATY
ncbi:MAG: M24 family metallopeptidase [Endomicrobium sp.]|jgi:Xaa-Pro aminopeptidase|nr:M24 family metallopeptidase [Endomicrobium sp.]